MALVLVGQIAGCVGSVGPVSPTNDAGSGRADASIDPVVDAADPSRPDGPAPARTTTVVWVGTGAYDPGADGRLRPFALAGGALTAGPATAAGSLPSWFALSPGGDRLYAVDENNGRIVTFAVAPRTGALTAVGTPVDSGGEGPVHIALDRTGRWLLVAHYTSGDVAVLPVSGGVVTGPPADVEATGRFTHQVVVDPTNRFVFVPCVGANHVAQLVFDAERGTLAPNTPAAVTSETGAGPRHMVLHPGGAHAYVVNELGSTVTAYGYDAARGTLTRRASIATIPDDFEGANTGAEIAIAADGDVVYASNRGHDSIAVLGVGTDGALRAVARTPTGGAVPRSFAITPAGDRLLVANQDSNRIVSFAIDPAAGTLSSPGAPVDTGGTAFFVGVYEIPAE